MAPCIPGTGTCTADFRCVGISSFAVDDSVGWLVQVSFMLFVFTGSARLVEGVNANSVRLTCTSQPTESSTRHSNAAEICCTQVSAVPATGVLLWSQQRSAAKTILQKSKMLDCDIQNILAPKNPNKSKQTES